MNSQDFCNLSEAYMSVYAPQEEVEQIDEVNVYDVILSHLLDEGYADTQEQAEVIMVNMSEDWRESIVEEKSDEGLSRDEKKAAVRRAKEAEKRDKRREEKRIAQSWAGVR